MDLATLVFKSETADLKKASDAIETLATGMEKLAKAEKSYADAGNKVSKSQEEVASSADKVVSSEKNKTKAVETSTEAVKKNVSVLERQQTVLEGMTTGLSRGQASLVATAKQYGATTDEIKELIKVLETQRKLIGGDPFDKSLSGIKALQNQYTELKESIRQYNSGAELSSKQTKELARDKERLIERLKSTGASFSDIRKAVRDYNTEFSNLANKYNTLSKTENDVIKQRKDLVNATNYITLADQKMAAALSTSNAELDRAGTDSLVKYENALKKSGISQDVVTKKLATYKTQLTQVQAQEAKVREQHLARAIQPQLTDIAVSLYSGQAPMTVLLQQSGQLVDLLKLSGVEANNFGKLAKEAFYGMVPAMATVAKGLADLVTGLAVDAGRAFINFSAGILGVNTLLDIHKRKLAAAGEEGFKYIGNLQRYGTYLAGFAGVVMAGLITSMGAVVIASKQVTEATNDMSKNLVSNGALLGSTTTEMYNLAKSAVNTGSSFVSVLNVFSEIAKVGNISAEAIIGIAEAALQLESVGGRAATTTVEMFSKLAEKPVETLTEYAIKSGLVNAAELERVNTLVKLGKETAATTEATNILTAATKQEAELMYASLTPLSRLWVDIKSGISGAWGAVQELAGTDAIIRPIVIVLQTVAMVANDVWHGFDLIGKTLGMIMAVTAARSAEDARGIFEAYKQDIDGLANQHDDFKARIMQQGKYSQEALDAQLKGQALVRQGNAQSAKDMETHEKVMKTYRDATKKDEVETLKRTDYILKKQQEAQKQLREGAKLPQQDLDLIASVAGKEWDDKHKKSQTAVESFYNSIMKSATNAGIAVEGANADMTKSQIKLLEVLSDSKWNTLSEAQKQNYLATMQSSIAAEQQAKSVKELADAEDFRLSILGKSDRIGRQYYEQMEALEKHAKVAGWSREQIEELTVALFKSTPAWQAVEKAIEKSKTELNKFSEESIAYRAGIDKENSELDLRAAMLGKNADEQRQLQIEYQKSIKLTEVDVALKKKLREIEQSRKVREEKAGLLSEADLKEYQDAVVQAEQDAADKRKVINRDVAMQYAEDFYKEFNRISNGITDAITTALFDGGKAGSKKLRDLIVNELKKPVTVVVQAAVNVLLSGLMGSLGLGGLSGAGGGGGLLGMALQGTQLYSGLTSGTGILGNIGSFLGLGSTASTYALSSTGLSLGAGATSGIGLSAGGGGLGVSMGGQVLGSGSTAATGGFGSMLGTALPIIGGIGLLISGLSRKLKDTGIEGTFGGESGFEGESYRYYKGGFLRSDKTTRSALDKETATMLQDAFKAMRDQTASFAEALGLDTSKIKDFVTDMKVSTWNLKPEEIQAKLNEALATANNELAQQLIGTWETTTEEVTSNIQASFIEMENGADAVRQVTEAVTQTRYVASEYAKEGETAIQTLTRLASSLTSVNAIFDTLGFNLMDTSLAGASAASALVDVFGGLERLTSVANAYYDAMYSDAEKQVARQRQLVNQFNKLGINIPKSVAEYRQLVEDALAAGNNELAAKLMELGPLFAEIMNGIIDTQTTIRDDSARLAQEAAEAARRAREEAEQALKKERDDAMNNLRNAVNAEKKVWQDRLNTLQEAQSKIKGVFDVLTTAIKELRDNAIGVELSAETGKAFITRALQVAKATGELPDAKELSDAISAARSGLGIEQFASVAEQKYATLKLAGELEALQGTAGEQLSEVEYQIKLAKDQIKILEDILEYWEKQLEAANGNISATMSVTSAVEAMKIALQKTLEEGFTEVVNSGGGQGGGGDPILDQLKDLVKRYSPNTSAESVSEIASRVKSGDISLLEATNVISGVPVKSKLFHEQVEVFKNFDAAGYYADLRKNIDQLIGSGMSAQEIVNIAIAMGVSLTDMANAYGVTAADIAANLYRQGVYTLPPLAVGTNFVPEDMNARIHKGERIIPAADNRKLMSILDTTQPVSNNLNAEIVYEIRQLRLQNERLEKRVEAIQQSSRSTNEILSNVTEGGTVMRTEAV